MSESTLSADFEEIRLEVADYLGFGRDSDDWSTDDTNRLTAIMKAGMAQFYFPPKVGERDPHRWSFLTPVTTLSITGDDQDIDLPDDFGGMACRYMTFDENEIGPRIDFIGEGQLRTMRQGDESTGQPQYAAVRPKSSTGTTGQRWEVLLYPIPDAAYTVYYRYRILPDNLSSGLYAYGGASHTQTIIQSCIAMAELRLDGVKGNQWEQFLALLESSIEQDLQVGRKEKFGYNGDDDADHYQRHYAGNYVVTLNGSDPDTF